MNVDIAAQMESPLVESLQATIQSKPFNYKIDKNFPILSKNRYSVQADSIPGTSTDSLNGTLTFKVPRYGLLRGIVIRTAFTTSATKTATLTRLDQLGARLFSNVSLRSHSRVIQDNSSDYILSRILESSDERKSAYLNMTTGVPTVDNNVSSVVYTPLFFYFSEQTENFLDTTFCEPLEIVATVNSQAGLWGTDEVLSTLGIQSCELFCYYTQLENSVHQSLIASQFPMGSNLTMLANDCYVETPTSATYASGNSLSIEHEIKCKNVAMSGYVYARNKNTNALLPITDVTIRANGQEIFLNDRASNIFDNTLISDSIGNVPGADVNMFPVYWSLDKDKTYQSGVVAFQGLNNPIMTVVVDTSNGVSASDVIEIRTVWDYSTLLSIASDTGSVQRSLTN